MTPLSATPPNRPANLSNWGLDLKRPLPIFHDRFIRSWDKLPPNGCLQEIAIRIATIVTAPLFYTGFGALYFIGRALEVIGSSNQNPLEKVLSLDERIALKADEVNQKIAALKKAAHLGWQQEAMALIRKSRYDIPSMELKRLKAAKVLTDDVSLRLDASINKVTPKINKKNLEKIKILMAEALEIQSLYGDTHHVFIHAQASNWLGLTYLVKELERTFKPEKNIRHFKFLRPPLKLAQPGTASALWKSFRNIFWGEENISNVQEYIHSKWFVMDHDGETREHLLSADGYFFNPQLGESSLYFLVNNSNILGKPDTIKFFYNKIIRHYNPKLSDEKIAKLVNKVFNAVKVKEAACGNLFTICVPKIKSKEIQYRAHPFGVVCTCHPEEESVAILEKLQKGVFDSTVKCESHIPIPQYRIYTPLLQPELTPTYLLTPYKKSDRKAMKAEIRQAVAELRQTVA